MNDSDKRVVEEIYDAPAERIPEVSAKAIDEVTCLLKDYANSIVKKSDVVNKRWILLNLLHVLYKDVFLLQTEDLENILTSDPKKLKESLDEQCRLCNKDLSCSLNLEKLNHEEETKGLCLDCFISEVKNGGWWDENWIRLKSDK